MDWRIFLQQLIGFMLAVIRRYSLWAVRIALLWVILTSLSAPSMRVQLENPPRAVEAVTDHVCVHTRLIDEVHEWVIQRSLQLVREMGANTIVEFFPWAYIEREPNQYDWRQADTIVRHAENQGLRVIARMGFVPEWARPSVVNTPTTLNYLPDDAYDDFAEFVAVFAERYAGRIDHLIIWNEPNLAFEWGYRPPDAAAYTRLLQAVYDPVHQANPDVVILGGALAPTLEPVGSPNGLIDTHYLEAMYQAGAGDYFDALAVHTYGFTHPPEQAPAHDRLNFRRAELLFEIMGRYGDGDKDVYITESGWNDHPRWTQAVRPAQRVQYTVDALAYADVQWEQVESLCLWVLRYPVPTLSYPDHFTLVNTNFQISPLYYAVQDYARGSASEERLWLAPPTE
ncbi:MAG: hypothetical protein ACFE0Q_09940 [Anaerolineae bacterium]